jgi:hypothetical protein
MKSTLTLCTCCLLSCFSHWNFVAQVAQVARPTPTTTKTTKPTATPTPSTTRPPTTVVTPPTNRTAPATTVIDDYGKTASKSVTSLGSFSALESDVAIGSGDHVEITAVAIPKGSKCGGGVTAATARFISSSGRDEQKLNSFGTEAFLKQELNADFSAHGPAQDLTASVDKALSDKAYFPITDNQFVRLGNGDLIAARMANFPRPNKAPFWNGKTGTRGGMVTVRSNDCGDTWQYNGVLDPANITLTFNNKDYPGAGAYPQYVPLDAAQTKGLWVGSTDRQEVYADPWDGETLYASFWIGANDDRFANWGPYDKSLPSVKNAMILSSPDGGKTWASRPIVMFDNNAVPIAMTTTRAKRLFLFNCVGSTPTLHFVKDGKYVQSWPVFHGDAKSPENGCAGGLDSAATAQLTKPGFLNRVNRDVSISRVDGSGTRDTVRLVYPAVRGGRRVAHVVVVRIQEPSKLAVDQFGNPRNTGPILVLSKLNEETISAASETGNIIYPTFIETDRVDLPKRLATNTAVLYWYETAREINMKTKTGAVRLFTRYSVFRDEGTIPGGIASKPQDLSVTNGSRRTWSPLDGEFVGDYMRGAFAYDGKLRFIAQWPERSPGQKLRIHYNVVTVEP